MRGPPNSPGVGTTRDAGAGLLGGAAGLLGSGFLAGAFERLFVGLTFRFGAPLLRKYWRNVGSLIGSPVPLRNVVSAR